MGTRRGILGALLAAPVAGPEVVKAASNGPLDPRARVGQKVLYERAQFKYLNPEEPESFSSAFVRLMGDPKARALWEEYQAESYYTGGSLDPDLQANRSMSLAAKLLIQKQRHLEQIVPKRIERDLLYKAMEAVGLGRFM